MPSVPGCDTLTSKRPSCGTTPTQLCTPSTERRHVHVDCIVQEVTIQRFQAEAVPPLLGWLTGNVRLLYAEVTAKGARGEYVRRTETAIPLPADLAEPGTEDAEVWVFGVAAAAGQSPEGADPGERVIFPNVRAPVQLLIKIFRSHASWHLALGMRAPLEPVGEGSFLLDDRDADGRERCLELTAPDGTVCGQVCVSVIATRLPQHGPDAEVCTAGATTRDEHHDEDSPLLGLVLEPVLEEKSRCSEAGLRRPPPEQKLAGLPLEEPLWPPISARSR